MGERASVPYAEGFRRVRLAPVEALYDLHCHYLPGVDDGSRSAQETDAMLRDAAESGTLAVLATPHRKDVTEDWSVDHLERLMDQAEERLVGQGLELEIFLGMENHLDPRPRERNRGWTSATHQRDTLHSRGDAFLRPARLD